MCYPQTVHVNCNQLINLFKLSILARLHYEKFLTDRFEAMK